MSGVGSRPTGGRVAVVTGASAGVGRAVSRAFAERGFDVALLARGAEGLAGAARDVNQTGRRALAVPVDIAVFEEVDRAAGRVEQDSAPSTSGSTTP